jgi:hypothetical protein
VAERLHCGVWANSIDARRLVTNGGAGLTSRAISTVPTPRQARKPTSLLGTGALAVCDGGSLYVGRSDGVDPSTRCSSQSSRKPRPAFGCHRTSPTRRPSREEQAELLPAARGRRTPQPQLDGIGSRRCSGSCSWPCRCRCLPRGSRSKRRDGRWAGGVGTRLIGDVRAGTGTVRVLGQPRRPRCRGPSRQRAPCCRRIQ